MDPFFENEMERPTPRVAGRAGRFLFRQLKNAILDGHLTAGTQTSLPSVSFEPLSHQA
jgi:hypothetical protein